MNRRGRGTSQKMTTARAAVQNGRSERTMSGLIRSVAAPIHSAIHTAIHTRIHAAIHDEIHDAIHHVIQTVIHSSGFAALLVRLLILLVSFMLPVSVMLPGWVLAQTTGSAQMMGMGSAGVASDNGSHSVFVNPAAMLRTSTSIAISWSRFVGLRAFSNFSAATILTAGRSRFGLGLHRFGSDFYHRTSLTLAAAYPLENLLLGLSTTGKRIYQGSNYDALQAVEVHLGAVMALSEGVYAAFTATNVFQSAYFGTSEKLPSDLSAGIDILIHPDIRTSADLVKDLHHPVSVRWGMAWHPVERFAVYAGFSTRPQTYAAGFRLKTEDWHLTIAFQQHIPLGLTPALDIERFFASKNVQQL